MTTRDLSAESKVQKFYDGRGWNDDGAGVSVDAKLWEDLRPCAKDYVASCRRKLLAYLPSKGDLFLDAASGPIQYPEYLEYSAGFRKRVCVDISKAALDQAEKKLGAKGDYVQASILELPFASDSFDAVVSLHTIYHIDKDQQEAAVRQLLRVAKPGAPVLVVYANPDRIFQRLKKAVKKVRKGKTASVEPLYYFAHPLDWWKRFEGAAKVEVLPWRSLTAQESKLLVPDNAVGRFMFSGLLKGESLFSKAVTRIGAYPLIILRK